MVVLLFPSKKVILERSALFKPAALPMVAENNLNFHPWLAQHKYQNVAIQCNQSVKLDLQGTEL